MNIALLLEMASEAMADRSALSFGDRNISYAELRARVLATAGWISQRDTQHIAFLGLNSPALPIALFASAIAGRVFVPLNYRLPDADLRRLLARITPAIVVIDDDLQGRVESVPGVSLITRSAFLELGEARAEVAASLEIGDEERALLLFTSGTTGEPKAAVLRHQNLTAYVVQTIELASAGEDEAALISVPPYHIAGVSSALTSVFAGRRMVQLSAFAPADWIAAVQEQNITHAMVVPTMLGRILDEIERQGTRLPSLRHLAYGGGRMPVATIERTLFLLPHVDLVNAYGLTETSSTIAVLGPEDHRLAFASSDPAVKRRLGSVGRPLPSVELEVRGPDGTTQPVGVVGEVWIRGEQVSGEYVGRNAKRADGWLPTNDCGWLDEAGYLFVEGRLDDVIVRGGENISPGEVEDVLRAHQAVRDAAVVGVPDEEWGERIVAVVVAAQEVAEGELKNWVRERLRSTRVPAEIHFRTDLPFNETGKLLRRELRQQLASRTQAAH